LLNKSLLYRVEKSIAMFFNINCNGIAMIN